jgi:hypothetical protein
MECVTVGTWGRLTLHGYILLAIQIVPPDIVSPYFPFRLAFLCLTAQGEVKSSGTGLFPIS